MVKVADAILEGAGVTLDKDSHEYRVLCRETLKGVIAATRAQLARMTGRYAHEGHPPAAQESAKSSAEPVLSRICGTAGSWWFLRRWGGAIHDGSSLPHRRHRNELYDTELTRMISSVYSQGIRGVPT